jgi:cytochrome P450
MANFLRSLNNTSFFQTTPFLMNCLRCLADNPDVQKKLRAEVQSAVNGDRSLNAVKFNNVPYLRAFIKEAFR